MSRIEMMDSGYPECKIKVSNKEKIKARVAIAKALKESPEKILEIKIIPGRKSDRIKLFYSR